MWTFPMYTVSYLQSNFSLSSENQNSWTKGGKQMAWDFWILSRAHLHLKSVLVPGLVILQRTSFLMQVVPNVAFLIANRCLKPSPRPPHPPSPIQTFLCPYWVLTLAWGVYISKTPSWNHNITAVRCLAWVQSTMTFHWPYNQKSLTSPAHKRHYPRCIFFSRWERRI